MGKNVLIISTSLRKGSNSERLAREVARGVEENGHTIDFVNLADRRIGYCKGCLACHKVDGCVIDDDMGEMLKKVVSADVLVFSTPIYFFEMSGQMKVFLDRCNPFWMKDYNFREVYLVTASAETDDDVKAGHGVAEYASQGMLGWVENFPKALFGGVLSCGGLVGPNAAEERKDMLEKAFSFGKAI